MKKTVLMVSALAALLFASCANDDDNDATDTTSQQQSTEQQRAETEQQTRYTLTFDANYPFDNTYTYDHESKQVTYASEFTENDRTYFYQGDSTGKQEAITDSLSTVLPESPYSYTNRDLDV